MDYDHKGRSTTIKNLWSNAVIWEVMLTLFHNKYPHILRNWFSLKLGHINMAIIWSLEYGQPFPQTNIYNRIRNWGMMGLILDGRYINNFWKYIQLS